MIKQNRRFFIDVNYLTEAGPGNSTAGSVFLSNVPEDRKRVIGVLAKGKGCGIRAGVTASLTATMALRLAESGAELDQIAELILHSPEKTFIDSLESPAFSVVEVTSDGKGQVLEFGHPPVHLYRGGEEFPIERVPNAVFNDMKKTVYRSTVQCEAGDRLILFTDSFSARFGGVEILNSEIKKTLGRSPGFSSRELIHHLYKTSFEVEGGNTKERERRTCFTVAALYMRKPKRLCIATGAPYDREKDKVLAKKVDAFGGFKAICGGTTAHIIARERGKELRIDGKSIIPGAPPAMTMEGVDLITEGTLTLGKVIQRLEYGVDSDFFPKEPAERLIALILESDLIRFIVGTRINETHQDPNLPAELDIRRNVVRRITGILKERYLKETAVEYL